MDVWSHWTTPGRARERLLELCSLEEDFVFSYTPSDATQQPTAFPPGPQAVQFCFELSRWRLALQQQKAEQVTEAGALETLVNQQIVTAMKAHDQVRTGTLRLIKNALKNKSIEKRAVLTQPESEQILATMIKQRRDSIEQFTKGNRPELAAIEAAEIVVIEEFLPRALDEAGLQALVAEAVAEVAAASGKTPTPKEMGQVIKAVQAKLQAAGVRAEGRVVSELVKRALAG
jgi:uncharacterized protein YqeY